jgi:DNA-binding beta-propeller fold protein YncE
VSFARAPQIVPEAKPQWLPTGQLLTPSAAPGSTFVTLNPHLPGSPRYVVGQTISEAASPDGKTLLVLTSGYNIQTSSGGKGIAAGSNEYVFVFSLAGGGARQTQVLQLPNTYVGIAFAPDGRFVVSGGKDDDLHVFEPTAQGFRESANSPIKLQHQRGIGIAQAPLAQGVAVSADGARAVVANRYNASVTVVDLMAGAVAAEIDLRPGKSDPAQSGVPGGEYLNSVAIVGDATAFVSSERDREIVIVDLTQRRVTGRVAVPGNPNKMILNRNQTRLYVAVDNADVVAVIDTQARTLLCTLPVTPAVIAPAAAVSQSATPAAIAPAASRSATTSLAAAESAGATPVASSAGRGFAPKRYRGASPNGLALSADEGTLYVTDRGLNALAVIDLRGPGLGDVVGMIPTGWYPSDVAVGPHDRLYVVNTQSVPGPNPGNCLGYQKVPCPVKNSPVHFEPNDYILDLAKGGFLSLPAPHGAALEKLTRRVARNNHFESMGNEVALLTEIRRRIKHVIYIVKENRTYDQVLGDIGRGASDPKLTEFPYTTTPNLHRLADQFVLLDHFFDSGNVSGNGWPWSTSARESDAGAKMLPVNYAGRGGSYDWEGANSNVNVGLEGAARVAAEPLLVDAKTGKADPDLLPGTANIAAPDGPDGEIQQGYLWDAALRAGLTVRNYGFLIDLTRYSPKLAGTPSYIPLETDPFSKSLTVSYAANPELASRTDGYFRGFDSAMPDTFREAEWQREFAGFVADGKLPALSLVRFMADHTGSYANAIDGVNTPELQVADNDYAVGRLVEAVAHSPYAADTLIFIVEDDAQDGPDHLDAHRSIAFIVGPYVKHRALVPAYYTTVNLLRTITDVLGLDHLGVFDATAAPMSEVFDLAQADWDYTAKVSGLLKAPGVSLPIPPNVEVAGPVRRPTHPAAYWAARTRGMDFDAEDKVDAGAYNRLLWQGLIGGRPYTTGR